MSKLFRCTVLFVVSTSVALASTVAGVISDSGEQRLAGAHVILRSIASADAVTGKPRALTALTRPLSVQVVALTDGRFEFIDVAPGRYILCVTPNDHQHVNSCSTPQGGEVVNVLADTSLIQVGFKAARGTEVVVTVVQIDKSLPLPTHAFLASGDGSFIPMENEGSPGRFSAVVPSFTEWRLVTSTLSGPVQTPNEVVRVGAQGVAVNIIVSR